MGLTKINEIELLKKDILILSQRIEIFYIELRERFRIKDNFDDKIIDRIRILEDELSLKQYIKEDKKRIRIDDMYFPENSVAYLSVRCINALKSYEIYYIDELIKLTKKELSMLDNIGKKSVREIVNLLEKLDLKLKEET